MKFTTADKAFRISREFNCELFHFHTASHDYFFNAFKEHANDHERFYLVLPICLRFFDSFL